MPSSKQFKSSTLLFAVVITLIMIPQTRQPIQVFLQKGIAMIVKPSLIDVSERLKLSSYDWKLQDISKNTFDFTELEGKVVVINFWATWCPPCIAEMPSLDKLHQKYASNDAIVFLFVSNEETNIISNFIKEKGYSFSAYKSLNTPPQEFNVTSIPRTFIVSKTGEIVIDRTGAADWNSNTVLETLDDLIKAF